MRYKKQITPHQDHVRAFQRDVCCPAHGNAYLCFDECRSIIDPVTDQMITITKIKNIPEESPTELPLLRLPHFTSCPAKTVFLKLSCSFLRRTSMIMSQLPTRGRSIDAEYLPAPWTMV